MAKRLKPWKELSPTYRARLERAGITAKSRRAGADLRVARGHPRPPRAGEAPEALTNVERPTSTQRAALRAWRSTLAPDWLPDRRRMADHVAAVVSGLRHPRYWKEVTFYAAASGPWTIRVEYTIGHPQEIQLDAGDWQELYELLKYVMVTGGYVADEAAWRRFIERGREFDVISDSQPNK